MVISLRAIGAQSSATAAVTAVSATSPASTVVGDAALLIVGVKPYNATITTPANWTLWFETTNGTTAQGADTGSMKIAVFRRTNLGANVSTGNIGQSGANSMGAVIAVYQKAADESWDFSEVTGGGDTTNGANFSATGAANIALAVGDWLFAAAAVNSDAGTPSAAALSAAGATLTPTTSRGAFSITTGNDMRLIVGDAPVTAGASTGAPSLSYTNASSSSGAVVFGRLRVIADPPPAGFAGIASATTGDSAGADVTSTSIPDPGTASAGDVMLAVLSIDDVDLADISSSTAGWTYSEYATTSERIIVARGVYGSVSWPLVITHDAEQTAWILHRLTNAALPIFIATATGSGSQADPPSLSPAGGSQKFLWIAVGNNEDGGAFTSPPSGFSGLRNSTSSPGGALGSTLIATAYRHEEVATLNPGAFAGGPTDDWGALTIAVAPNVVVVTASATQPIGSLAQTATATETEPTFTASASQSIGTIGQTASASRTVPTFTASASQSIGTVGQSATGSQTGPTFSGSATQRISTGVAAAYSAFKFVPTALRDVGAANSIQISEFQILVGGARQTGASAFDESGVGTGSEGAEAANNGSTSGKWLSFSKLSAYMVVVFPSAIAATGFRIATANDAPERDPVAFDVYGSNDTTHGSPGTFQLISSGVMSGDPGRDTYLPDFPIAPIGGIGQAATASSITGVSGSASQSIGSIGQTASGAFSIPTRTASAAQQVRAGFGQTASASRTVPTFSSSATQQIQSGIGQTAGGSFSIPTRTASAAQGIGAFGQSASGAWFDGTVASASQSIGTIGQSAASSFSIPTRSASASQSIGTIGQSATATSTVRTASASQQIQSGFGQTAASSFSIPVRTASASQSIGTIGQTASATEADPPSATASQSVGTITQTATATRGVPTFTASASQQVRSGFGQSASVSAGFLTASATQSIGTIAQTATATRSIPTVTATATQAIGGHAQPYRAYRFQPTAVRSVLDGFQMSEFQVISGGIRQAGATAHSQGLTHPSPSETPAEINDNNVGTKNYSPQPTSGYLYLVFPTAIVADAFRIATANDAPNRDPVAFDIYGSNDTTGGSPGTWTLIRRGTIEGDPGRLTYLPDYEAATALAQIAAAYVVPIEVKFPDDRTVYSVGPRDVVAQPSRTVLALAERDVTPQTVRTVSDQPMREIR